MTIQAMYSMFWAIFMCFSLKHVLDPLCVLFMETAVMRALWGATRLSRAKEIVFSVLSKGHCVFPVMHKRYERLLWLARVAQRRGVTQAFTQAISELGGRPPRLARWGVRSKRRPPWGGALASAGGARTSHACRGQTPALPSIGPPP